MKRWVTTRTEGLVQTEELTEITEGHAVVASPLSVSGGSADGDAEVHTFRRGVLADLYNRHTSSSQHPP